MSRNSRRSCLGLGDFNICDTDIAYGRDHEIDEINRNENLKPKPKPKKKPWYSFLSPSEWWWGI